MKSMLKMVGILGIAYMGSANAYQADNADWQAYCEQSGGVAEKMPVEFITPEGSILGNPRSFCNFYLKDAFIAIGLESFSSDKPSIAATYMKKMGEIADNSALWEGSSFNPSQNVCTHLGGATVGFISDGGFVNSLGQSDVCVFGDGSMVSGWSLIYMANHRDGYDEIKSKVKASPLNITIPQ